MNWRFAFACTSRNVNGGDDSKQDNEKFLHDSPDAEDEASKNDSS